MKKRKNPLVAIGLSLFVFAGVGQIYNKQYIKGIVIILAFSSLIFLSLKPLVLGYLDYINTAANVENIGLFKVETAKTIPILTTIVWIGAMVDAYIFARKHNSELEKLL